MTLNIKRIPFLVFMVVGFCVNLFSQVDITPTGYITASGYVIPEADDPLNSVGLRGAFNLDGFIYDAQIKISLELYSNLAGVMDDTEYTDDWYYPGAYEGTLNDKTMFAADLKEAWIGFILGDFDLNIGKQILTWGQADGTNPTDNVNPVYIGTRSVSGSMEKKMGIPMVNLRYYLPTIDGNIQAVFMPMASQNNMPGLDDYISIKTPDMSVENMEGGIRGLFYPGAISFSVSYLTIMDRYPSDALKTEMIPYTTITVPTELGHNRQHIIGLDAVWLVNGFDFRTEWAYTITKDFEGTEPFEINPFVNGVIQGSRSFFDGIATLSLTWAPKYIFNFEKPEVPEAAPFLSQLYIGQGYEIENMVGLRLQTKFLNETLQPEVMFLTALSAKDHLTTVGLSYNIADGWNLKAGVNLYGSFLSDSDSDRGFGAFGNDNMKDSDVIYLEIRRDF